jgi:hypothetical protein
VESEPTLHVVPMRRKKGVRTYALMVLGMAVVTLIVTCLSVIIIRYRWHSQVTDDLSQDLEHSVRAFQELQAERLGALDRENSLLAELPTLKALMTSGDDLTIQDGAVEFWQLSGTDLFALADSSGRIVAAYSKTATARPALREELRKLVGSTGKHYLIDGSSLYACSLRPLYFGSNQEGTLLGYVISGVSIERTVRQSNDPTAVEATFLSAGKIAATTLSPSVQVGLGAQAALLAKISRKPATVKLGNSQFLAATEDLSASASAPLQLLVLKSLDPAERAITRINRMVMSAGFLALLCGAVLMVTVSRLVTPLSKSYRAVFGLLGQVMSTTGSRVTELWKCWNSARHLRGCERRFTTRTAHCLSLNALRPLAVWLIPCLMTSGTIWLQFMPTRSFSFAARSLRRSARSSLRTSAPPCSGPRT